MVGGSSSTTTPVADGGQRTVPEPLTGAAALHELERADLDVRLIDYIEASAESKRVADTEREMAPTPVQPANDYGLVLLLSIVVTSIAFRTRSEALLNDVAAQLGKSRAPGPELCGNLGDDE